MMKGMKDIKLSGGSDLVFYTNSGKRIETEEEKKEQQEEVKQSVQSSIKKSRVILLLTQIADIEAAKIRYLQRKGLL